MKYAGIFFLILIACSQTPLGGGQKDCFCTEQWQPVCGQDGQTYSNKCFAECAGVQYEEGACKGDCPPLFEPVCGEDGQTYDNACLADVAGVRYSMNECQ